MPGNRPYTQKEIEDMEKQKKKKQTLSAIVTGKYLKKRKQKRDRMIKDIFDE